MVPGLEYNPKFQLLEEYDLIAEGDEWYDPVEDKWKLVDSDPDIEDWLAAVGDYWSSEKYKAMRRKNPVHIPEQVLDTWQDNQTIGEIGDPQASDLDYGVGDLD